MAQRSVYFRTYQARNFHFRPPAWRPRTQLNAQTSLLLAGSLGWLALYSWLALRLLQAGVAAAGRLEVALIIASIVLGVPLALGWWATLRRWRARVCARLIGLR